MNRTLIENLVEHHEGRKNSVYRDSNGNLTVGIGCLLMSNVDGDLVPARYAQELFSTLGIDFQAVCNGELSLTDEQVDAIFEEQISGAVYVATLQFPNFDSIPDNAQAALVDMIFNLGSVKFAQFKLLIAAVNEKDWIEVARQMRESLWCSQVKSRCAEDMKLMESAA